MTNWLDQLQGEIDTRWWPIRDQMKEALPAELRMHIPDRVLIPGWTPETGSVAPKAFQLGESLLAKAVVHRGKPYTWGGDGVTTFDCSSLTQRAARDVGITIGRTTYQQILNGREVPFSEVQIGDLVFSRFSDTDGVWETPEHVSIWAGNGKVFEAGNPLDFYNWGSRGAVRVRRIV